MPAIDLAGIGMRVVWLAFGLGALFGMTAQRTHFCTMGALTDIFTMGDWNRMRQWLLAMAVAIAGTSVLAHFGLIDTAKSLYTGMRLNWLSHLAGGACFGFGMVLASGCGNKTLVRIGSGNLKSLVVFIVVGLTAFTTLKGVLAIPRTALLDSHFITLATHQDLPSMLASTGSSGSTSLAAMQLVVGGVAALMLSAAVFASSAFRARDVVRNNIVAGVVIGSIIVAAWFVCGHVGYVAEDPNTLQEAFVATNSGRMEAFSFVAPFAYTLDLLMMWTDVSKIVTFGIAATLGVVAGSCIMALAGGVFRWEGFGSVEDVGNHLLGAVLMGFGGVTALGCTIGQGLSGVSLLTLGSLLTLAGIIAGAFGANAYQMWRVNRQA
ncbi:MAG: YeeE/YedE family protein [Herminiimonas sp.]|nr:YeeE/YedE family protein [Herminiimonas sp.]